MWSRCPVILRRNEKVQLLPLNNLPLIPASMILKALVIILVIVGVLAIGFVVEARRRRLLEAWMLRHPGNRLFWPVALDEHPEVPAAQMVEAMIGRLPMGWASAAQVEKGGDQVWLFEFRTTLTGNESSSWLTLVARRCSDESAAARQQLSMQAANPEAPVLVFGNWVYSQRKGLITVDMLESIS